MMTIVCVIPFADDYRRRRKPIMPILMDRTLTKYADQVTEAARLGRNSTHTRCDRVFAELLAKLEAVGNAMRRVDATGQISWRATPTLRQYLKDMELDAEADLDEF
jgi:hypothetical protein